MAIRKRERSSLSVFDEAKRLYRLGYDIHWIVPPEEGNRLSGKRPVGDWARSERFTWQQLKETYREGYNLGFQPGPTSVVNDQQLIIVEVDYGTDERDNETIRNACRDFGLGIPTAHSGGGGSHYHILCSVEQNIPHGAVLFKGRTTHTEIRVIAGGGNCVLPPSRHWSGGVYSWGSGIPSDASDNLLRTLDDAVASRGTISPISIEPGNVLPLTKIPRAIREIVKSGAGKGDRSEALFQVIAALYRAQRSPDDILATILHEDYAISEKARAQGSRWAATEVGRVVSKIDAEIAAEARVADEALGEIKKRFFKIQLGNSVRIGYLNRLGRLVALTQQDFKAELFGQNVIVDTKEQSLANLWLADQSKRSYIGVTYDPGGCEPDVLNLWRGFPREYSSDPPKEPALFLEHLLDGICAGNQKKFDWLWNWMAHLVQHPEEKPGLVPVLRGPTRTGKSVFTEVLIALVGDYNAHVVTDRAHLTGRFNAALEDKLLVIGEEVTWGGSIEVAGPLRNLITAPRLQVEKKGVDNYSVRSCHRIVLLSNERWVVQAQDHEGRFRIFGVSAAHQNDRPWFTRLLYGIEHGGLAWLRKALSEHKIDKGELYGSWGDDVDTREQQLNSLDPIDRWWFNCLDRGEILYNGGWPELLDRDTMFSAFRSKAARTAEHMTIQSFYTALARRWYPEVKSRRSIPILRKRPGPKQRHSGLGKSTVSVRIIHLDDAREAFSRSMGWTKWRS